MGGDRESFADLMGGKKDGRAALTRFEQQFAEHRDGAVVERSEWLVEQQQIAGRAETCGQAPGAGACRAKTDEPAWLRRELDPHAPASVYGSARDSPPAIRAKKLRFSRAERSS